MNTMFVLFINDILLGVYSSHKKANQAMLVHALSDSMVMTEYMLDIDVEFFTFRTNQGHSVVYEIQETEVDAVA